MVKTITVKDETWEKLTIKKIKEKFKSLDELINYLLEKNK
jgi:predicted CopG family antitoxin